MYKNILIPTDGSKCSDVAIQEGLQLAKDVNAEVTFLYVLEDFVRPSYIGTDIAPYVAEFYKLDKEAANNILAKAMSQAAEKGVSAKQVLVEREEPVKAILATSETADLIVIATHGRRGFNRFVFGSVAEGVIRQSDTPCLIIRQGDGAS